MRLAPEVTKHYTVTANAAAPTYAAKTDVDGYCRYYSVKLGDIIPELRNF